MTTPKTYLIGEPRLLYSNLLRYLQDTDQLDFAETVNLATNDISEPLDAATIISSIYAKLCYKSLTTKHNDNITKVRNIKDNVINALTVGHGSVFEHAYFNFITTNCSRIFTHEMVRHRVGTAFSQTSGRYVRSDKLDLVIDPILEQWEGDIENLIKLIEDNYNELVRKAIPNDADFGTKKKLTSALRRLLPNGQVNELGWSANIRTLRHLLMLRTSRHAEWEIRLIFNQVFHIINESYPLIIFDANVENIDGLLEVTGMTTQPYQREQ